MHTFGREKVAEKEARAAVVDLEERLGCFYNLVHASGRGTSW